MEENIVKQLVTKDGGFRIKIIQDPYPENPRYRTDEPLHCEDWNRHYTIMDKGERETRSSSARALLQYLLANYADYRSIIDELVQAGKQNEHTLDDKLMYDPSAKEWVLHSYGSHYNYETRKNEEGWFENEYFDCKKYDIDMYRLLDCVGDDTIDHFAKHLLNDKVKVMGYNFGYYGEISFSDGADCQSDGIAWLEKDEFLRYAGIGEEKWKNSTCKELEFLQYEFEAYGDGDVYLFHVEKLDRVKVHETHQDGSEHDYEREDWNEVDSCYGFYGTVDKVLPSMLYTAGYKMEELEEVA